MRPPHQLSPIDVILHCKITGRFMNRPYDKFAHKLKFEDLL